MEMKELKEGMDCLGEFCKKFESEIKLALAGNFDELDGHALSMTVDMMKDCSEAIEKKAKTMYYLSIVKAMEDAKDDDELRDKIMELSEDSEMRFYNSSRYANGQFAPKSYRRGYGDYAYPYGSEVYKPMMYYGDGYRMGYDKQFSQMGNTLNSNRGMTTSADMRGYSDGRPYTMERNESRYDKNRRGYTESKAMHTTNSADDKQENMRGLESFLGVVGDDIKEFKDNMSAEEKNMTKSKLMSWANMLN